MKTIVNYIPLLLLFTFLMVCNTTQKTLYDNEAMEVSGVMNHYLLIPSEAKINEAVEMMVDLHLEDNKKLKSIELELWRIDDQTTSHQRMELTKKVNGYYYYKMYFDYPGIYQVKAHIWSDGVKKVINRTITITM